MTDTETSFPYGKAEPSLRERIQFTQNPLAAPGHCAICGFSGGIVSDGRQFVDWGMDLDFYGSVIFCTSCFTTVATQLGFASYEETQLLRRQASDAAMVTESLKDENERLRKHVNNLVALRDSGFVPGMGNQEEGQADSDATEHDSGSVESDSVGGSSDIREDDESGSARSDSLDASDS